MAGMRRRRHQLLCAAPFYTCARAGRAGMEFCVRTRLLPKGQNDFRRVHAPWCLRASGYLGWADAAGTRRVPLVLLLPALQRALAAPAACGARPGGF